MYLETTFTAFGENYKVGVDTNFIDRNHDDENYAYWVVICLDRVFEVNVWKDETGKFTNKGKVYAFANMGCFEDDDAAEEYDIEFRAV